MYLGRQNSLSYKLKHLDYKSFKVVKYIKKRIWIIIVCKKKNNYQEQQQEHNQNQWASFTMFKHKYPFRSFMKHVQCNKNLITNIIYNKYVNVLKLDRCKIIKQQNKGKNKNMPHPFIWVTKLSALIIINFNSIVN